MFDMPCCKAASGLRIWKLANTLSDLQISSRPPPPLRRLGETERKKEEARSVQDADSCWPHWDLTCSFVSEPRADMFWNHDGL